MTRKNNCLINIILLRIECSMLEAVIFISCNDYCKGYRLIRNTQCHSKYINE